MKISLVYSFRCVWLAYFLAAAPIEVVAAEKHFTVYNWSNYIDKNVIIDFEARYKTRMSYKSYNTVSDLRALLKQLTIAPDIASEEIDVIILPLFLLQGLIEQNLLSPIRLRALRNDQLISRSLLKFIKKASINIGRTDIYAMPYLWGTTALAYDIKALRKRSFNFPRESWALIFDPKYASQFADCGIILADRPREVFQILRNYLGLDPHSSSGEDLTAAEVALRTLRPYVDIMPGFEAANALAYGDACIVFGQSQEIFIAQQEAALLAEESGRRSNRKKNAPQITYRFPSQGSLLWMDVIVIPAQSKKKQMAHRWIDHILDTENSRRIAEITRFASPNLRTRTLLPSKIRKNKVLYPTLANKKIFMDRELLDVNDLPDLTLGAREDRAWERFIHLRKR